MIVETAYTASDIYIPKCQSRDVSYSYSYGGRGQAAGQKWLVGAELSVNSGWALRESCGSGERGESGGVLAVHPCVSFCASSSLLYHLADLFLAMGLDWASFFSMGICGSRATMPTVPRRTRKRHNPRHNCFNWHPYRFRILIVEKVPVIYQTNPRWNWCTLQCSETLASPHSSKPFSKRTCWFVPCYLRTPASPTYEILRGHQSMFPKELLSFVPATTATL